MPAFTKSLFGQVMVALVLGVVVGVFWPDFAAQMKPLGDGFIRLIKMIIAPLVFGVVVHGIASAGDLKKVGRVGVKSIVYFEIVTTIALVLGIVVAYALRPGPRHERRPGLARRQRDEHLHRACGAHRGRRRLPHERHPVDVRRGLRRGRHPAGAGDRGAVRRGPVADRRARKARRPPDRAHHRCPVQDHRLHRPAGAARRLRRHRLHGRQLRRRLAAAARLPGRALLRLGRDLRLRHPRPDHAARRLLDPQVPRLPPRGADDRARHRLVGQRAAADHAQARAHGDQGLDRRPRHPDRLLVQPRRLLDLPDARHRLHRPGDQHAARDHRPAADPRRRAAHLEGRARHPRLGDRGARRDPVGGAGDPGDRPRAGALGRLVHGHGPRARQPDRQLRRHRRHRRLGGRHRPRPRPRGARRHPRGPDRRASLRRQEA